MHSIEVTCASQLWHAVALGPLPKLICSCLNSSTLFRFQLQFQTPQVEHQCPFPWPAPRSSDARTLLGQIGTSVVFSWFEQVPRQRSRSHVAAKGPVCAVDDTKKYVHTRRTCGRESHREIAVGPRHSPAPVRHAATALESM